MNTKECFKCRETKPTTAFYRKTKAQDGLQPQCKNCVSETRKLAWKKDSTFQSKQNERNRINRTKLRALVKDFLLLHPCVDCGEPDLDVLDFDHVRGRKTLSVSVMISRYVSVPTILAEIAKCEVRCANCHRRVTRRRDNTGYGALHSSLE